MVLVLKVAGVASASALALVLVRDAETRSLFVLLAAGVYLPLSVILFLIQRKQPEPPSPAWLCVTTLDVAIVGVAQALFPRLSVAYVGFTAIVMMTAVMLQVRWALLVASLSWASLAAASLYGHQDQPEPFAVAVAGLLLVGMAFLIGTLSEDQRRSADRSRRLARAISSVTSSLELPEVLGTLCDAAREALQARFSVVLLVEGDRLMFGAGSRQPPGFPGADQILSRLLTDPALRNAPTAVAVRTKQPVPVEDVLGDRAMTPWRDAAVRMGFASMVVVPMHRAGEPVGVLNVYLPRRHRFGPEEIEFLSALAENAGIAVDRARTFAREVDTAERLRELDRMKSEFVATVSHELRTPLTAIVGFALTLRREWRALAPAVREEFLERLGDNARSLEHLVTHLLDFGRLERGEFEIQLREHDLGELVARIVRNMAHELSVHDVRCDVSDGTTLMTDRYAFERILGNLLSNAAKFSPPGSCIDITAARVDGEVAVSVRDRGSGIREEVLSRVFELFYRESRAPGGTGIGLAVVRDLVELHGGRVEASNADPGAVLTVHLPAARVDRARAGAVRSGP